MAHQVIKYRLTAQGTVPDFLYLGNDGVGGVYCVPDPTAASPQDTVMVGISNDNATGAFEVVPSKAALEAYLTMVGSGWVTYPNGLEEDPVPFDPVAAADYVWSRLDALNA